jgi:hypothetical protein
MPDAGDPEVVRLSLPADPALRPVVEVAVAVLARRVGVDDAAVREARSRAGEAFEEMCAGEGDDLVEVEVSLVATGVVAWIRAGGVDRRVSATRPLDPPP